MENSTLITLAYLIALGSIFAMLFSNFKKHRNLKRELAKAKPKKRG